MDAAALWRIRVTWMIVGAVATLAVVSMREPSEGVANPTSPARTHESTFDDVPTDVPSADASLVATPNATIDLPPITDPPLIPFEATQPAPDVPADAIAPPPDADPAPVPAPAVEPFRIPLPMMPGARIMKRSQQPDEEHGGTIHTLALFVPAPGAQVEAFYRSALTDAKLSVSGGSTKPTTMGRGHRSSLRGRGRNALVHVNLQQPAGTLRTTVRIIWRPLP